MKLIISTSLIIFLIILSNCTKESKSPTESSPISPTENHSISGKVLSKGLPVESAIVSIDNSSNLRTQSDNGGNFKILNVPKGNHSLTASKSSTTGNFTERTTLITVESDMTISDLLLPVGVRLFEPDSIKDITLFLKWSPTDAFDFREYKVFQHNTSGLDESTGTLIHVATQINDTTFSVINLDPLTDYFFRVYTMNDVGRLGGSNIVSARTQNVQLIKNGSFESLNVDTGYPDYWQAYSSTDGYYFVDSTISQEGNYSIRIENGPGVNYYYQLVNPQLIVADSRYRLSYWIRHDGFSSSGEFAVFMNTTEFNWQVQANTVRGPKPATDWILYEYEFTAPNVNATNYSFGFYFCIHDAGKKAWLDNISLIKVL